MPGRTDSRRRLVILLVTFAVVAVALFARLAWWQVVHRDRLAAEAFAQTTLRKETPTRRGEIFDRSGVVVLATTVDRERLAAMPADLEPRRRREVATELIELLGLTEGEAELLRDRMTSDTKYVVLARGLTTKVATRLRTAIADELVEGVALESEPVRIYPHEGGGPDSTLAAHLLGFVNRDGVGQYGVEQYYQPALGGRPRIVHAERDVAARAIPDTIVVEDEGTPGEDLRLTIDAGLQLSLEQEVLAAWAADAAKSVSAVVMDPYTGEVLASGTYPSYDANAYVSIAADDPSRFLDPIVSHVYEPGSVFKMLTALAGLETGTVTITTRIKDVGTLKLDGGRQKVDDADRKGMGWMSFEDAIAFSRNVVAAKVALDLGANTREASTTLHDTWTRLGFGTKSGIDVAGEVAGIVRDPRITVWQEIDLANGSFGQGVAVTPIQLAAGFSAMVNGGHLVQPHVVKSVGLTDLTPADRGAVLEPAMSTTLTRLMNHVVMKVPFYREKTVIKGYEVGGKTGTAQIWDPKLRGGRGDWKNNTFDFSFIGYIARDPGVPDLVVAVRINEARPTLRRDGRLELPVMSYELFRRIAHDAISRPGLLPERRVPSSPTVADR